jgi:short-subunit dehydrogenase
VGELGLILVRIAGSTVLVTGATGGIGRAMCQHFAAAGATVVVSGRRATALETLADEIGARAVVADLGDPAEVVRLADSGPVDVLVANAALPASGDLIDYTPEQVERALAVNLAAPVMLARLLAPPMIAAGQGHIVFLGSLSGKAATPLSSLYTSTKFGLRGFALALRQDLAPSGVGVSIVQPGFVRGEGMFAATGQPTPSGVGTVTPDQVADSVLDAVERNRAEVNVAPLTLRVRCAIAVQFPCLAARLPTRRDAADISRRIVDAQRANR